MQRKTPTYKRQRFLVDFIHSVDGGCTATDLQKLVFLHMQAHHSSVYTFVPYKYGCYSFQLAEDVRILEMTGWVDHAGNRVSYAHGKDDLQHGWATDGLSIDGLRGDSLIKKVYTEYPYYAINSEIAERILSRREVAALNELKKRLRKSSQRLFTIGYEGISVERYLNKLIQNDVRLVCDVRRNPISRKFGFSKSSLLRLLQKVNIDYLHLSGLGIEADDRRDLKTKEDYEKLFGGYKKTLPDRKMYLQQLHDVLCKKKRVALTCFEQDPGHCHRHVIRDWLINEHAVPCEDL